MFNLSNLIVLKTTRSGLANYVERLIGQLSHPARSTRDAFELLSYYSHYLHGNLMNRSIAVSVITALQGHSIYDFLIFLLGDPALSLSPTAKLFVDEWRPFLEYSQSLGVLSQTTSDFTLRYTAQTLQGEVRDLANKQAGWHFSACKASIDRVEAFSIADMALTLEEQAPVLWSLLGSLLASDSSRARRRANYQEAQARGPHRRASDQREGLGSADLGWDEEDEYWEQVGEDLVDGISDETSPADGSKSKRRRRAGERSRALDPIVSY